MTDPTTPYRVLCLAGSLRRGSWNRRLLEAAAACAPAALSLQVYDALAHVPLFDEDLEQRHPAGVAGLQALRRAVAAADGVIIATPEYSHAMPGVLKNALDWLARESPEGDLLANKPMAVIGASSGPWGTRLAQASLRQVLQACEAWVMPAPTLFVASAARRFGDDGALLDEALAASLQRVTAAFCDWIARHRPEAPNAVAARDPV